jgi:hypothetical protein
MSGMRGPRSGSRHGSRGGGIGRGHLWRRRFGPACRLPVVGQKVTELSNRRRRQAPQHILPIVHGSTPNRWHVDVKLKSTAAVWLPLGRAGHRRPARLRPLLRHCSTHRLHSRSFRSSRALPWATMAPSFRRPPRTRSAGRRRRGGGVTSEAPEGPAAVRVQAGNSGTLFQPTRLQHFGKGYRSGLRR